MTKFQPFIYYVKKRIAEMKSDGIHFNRIEEGFSVFGTEWEKMSAVERAPYVREADICNKKLHESSGANAVAPLNTKASHFQIVKQGNTNSFNGVTNKKVTGGDNKVYPRMVKPKTTSAIVSANNAAKIDQMGKLPISIDNRSDEVYINDLLKNQKPTNLFFVIINCSYHCRDNKNGLFIPSEIGLSCFSFRKGIVDNYWSLVDPGSLPYGRRLEAMENKNTFKIPLPPFEPRFQDLQKILNNIRIFLKRYKMPKDDYTNVYCISPQTKFVKGCLDWLGFTVGSENFKFEYKIRSLTTLVQKLHMVASDYDPRIRMEHIFMEAIRCPSVCKVKPIDELMFGEAMDLIRGKTDWAFHEEFGCPYHRSAAPSGIQYCCLNIVNRYSMHIMNSLSRKFGLVPTMGCQIPCKNPKDDVEKINQFLINWGYLPQSLVYEELENEQFVNNEDEDANWFIKERQEFEQSHPEADVAKNSNDVHVHSNEDFVPKSSSPSSSKPKASEILEDWDDFFTFCDGEEFVVEILGDRLKETLAASGRGDLFW